MAAAANGQKSGYYRVNGGGSLERVSTKIIAAAALVTALGILWGVVAAGVRIAQAMQRPAIASVAAEVMAPIAQQVQKDLVQVRVEQALLLPKADFEADRALRDARESERKDEIREMRENFKYIRERMDRLIDARAGQRDRRGG